MLFRSKSIGPFSAVAYYFGRELNQTLNVPIGLIHTSWGGTPAEAWISTEALKAHGDFDAVLEGLSDPDSLTASDKKKFDNQLAAWEKKLADLDPGTKENWHNASVDDADWKTMELPAMRGGTELDNVDGVVWFRRVTHLPPSWARGDLELNLGLIDDIDTVWVNGVKVGTTVGPDKHRTYLIPQAALRVGPNLIAVRVVNLQDEGGFGGKEEDMRIGPPGTDAKSGATVARTWKYKVSHSGSISAPPEEKRRIPTVLYNTMIHPLVPFRIAGVIWYQGEANRNLAIQYRTLFPALIRDWRTQWGQGDFPFYYVQIAPYQYLDANAPLSAFLREAQMMTLKAVPNVGMAVTMDIGEKTDIHPRNKLDVGKRLSLWALANTYNQRDIVYSGPLYTSMKVEHAAIRVT